VEAIVRDYASISYESLLILLDYDCDNVWMRMTSLTIFVLLLFAFADIFDSFSFSSSHSYLIQPNRPLNQIWIDNGFRRFRWASSTSSMRILDSSIDDISSESDARISIAGRETVFREMQDTLEKRNNENAEAKSSGKSLHQPSLYFPAQADGDGIVSLNMDEDTKADSNSTSMFKQVFESVKLKRTDAELAAAIDFVRRSRAQNLIITAKDAMNCINILKLGKEVLESLEMLDYMRSRGIEVNTRVYNNLLDGCSKYEYYDLADKLFAHMVELNVPRDTNTYGSILSGYAKRGKWEEALALLRSMASKDGILPNSICFSYAITACIKSQQFAKADAILRELESSLLIANPEDLRRICTNAIKTYASSISMLSDDNLREEVRSRAQQILDRFLSQRRCEPDCYIFGAMISVLDNAGYTDAVYDLVTNHLCRYRTNNDVIPFNMAIKSLLRVGSLDKASAVYQLMVQHQVKANQFTMTDLITAYVKSQRHSDALSIFNDMLRHDIPRTAAIYGSVITAAEKLGQWKLTLSLLKAVWNEKLMVNTGMYNAAIAACGRHASFDICKALFGEMKERGIPRTITTYNLMIGACKKEGRWRFAVKYLNDARKERNEDTIYPMGLSPNQQPGPLSLTTATYSAAISVCVGSKEWNLALELLEEMEELEIPRNIVTYNTVIEALDAAEETIRAEIVYQSALRTGVYNHFANESVTESDNPSQQVLAAAANSTFVMDLHKFPTSVAKAAVMHVLGEICANALQRSTLLWEVDEVLRQLRPLEIITGRGKHVLSSGKRGVLRDEISKFLLGLGLEVEDNPINPGRILVPVASLGRWLNEQVEDDRRRKTEKSPHGNLFLRVALAKNAKDIAANVRATCPFSSAEATASNAAQSS
jgi:pentatricopeptide repeat protein